MTAPPPENSPTAEITTGSFSWAAATPVNQIRHPNTRLTRRVRCFRPIIMAFSSLGVLHALPPPRHGNSDVVPSDRRSSYQAIRSDRSPPALPLAPPAAAFPILATPVPSGPGREPGLRGRR